MAPGRETVHDDLILGAGMAGLTLGALLARAGRRVLMLEAHEHPGGYAHTFTKGPYRFCAQVHYVFHCGEGEPIHRLLAQLGLADEVRWVRLDPEGFDTIVIDGERYRIPNGLEKSRDRLIHRFPEAAAPLRAYFDVVRKVRTELDDLPEQVRVRDLLTAPYRFYDLLRYRGWTLQDFYQSVGMPPLLQGILAGQCGDYFLPPERVAFLIHAAMVSNYDRGAYYPERHYEHFIGSLARVVTEAPGCDILYQREVAAIECERGRVVGVRTTGGETFRARRYLSNIDPARTATLAGAPDPGAAGWDADYEYSASAFTLYLGLEGVDLRDHGFGNFNLWHYPEADINRLYRRQLEEHDLSNPWLFLASPSLMTAMPGLAPEGHQVLHAITCCDYRYFRQLRDRSLKDYNREKSRIRERILDLLDAHYLPGIRDHVRLKLTGSPTTNERFCWSPEGNAYGAALTPANLTLGRGPRRTPLENLYVVNATAGYPGIAGTVQSACRLFEALEGAGS